MKVAVVGTGYVGLVTGACFAESGNDVVCVDIDRSKVDSLRSGQVPIYEPGLDEVVHKQSKEGRLTFTTKLDEAMDATIVFLALPTPQGEDGSADLSYVLSAAKDIGSRLNSYKVIVDKSTVPVGTAKKVTQIIASMTDVEFDVVSNPEFLREGQALEDFRKPDRVVIGVRSDRAANLMHELYAPFVRRDPKRLIITDPESAEMIKYAANAFLATKITFMNQVAGLCEGVGADVDAVRRGIGMDTRIGDQFLYPGPGYGGSCFPKDTSAFVSIGDQVGYDLSIVRNVVVANEAQKLVIPNKVVKYFDDDVKGKKFALWGLAFKDNTDDMRESPALTIINELTSKGALVTAFDPQANDHASKLFADNMNFMVAADEYAALTGADGLIIATNWLEFFSPDFDKIKSLMSKPVIFDGRNLYDPKEMERLGFYYESIGRRKVGDRE